MPGPENPQTWNRYAYGLNNPVKYQDPDGHKPTAFDESGASGIGYSGPIMVWSDAPAVPDTLLLAPIGAYWGNIAAISRSSSSTLDTWGDPTCISCKAPNSSSSNAAATAEETVSSGGLPNDAKVYQYQKNMPKPGKAPTFSNEPRQGEAAISCQYGPACGGDPNKGLAQAFNRGPKPGEYYRETTVGQITSVGRTPDFDENQIVDGRKMPLGHLSIYGNNSLEAFDAIWSKPIPLLHHQ